MANIKSAKKRIKTINRKKTENRLIKSTLSTYIKKYKKFLIAEDLKGAEEQLKITISYIDTACSKGVIHKNNASRKVSRLTRAIDKLRNKLATEVKETKVEDKKVEAPVVAEEKPAEPAKTAKKPAAKKTEKAEKVEKPATKKAEKPAAKKAEKTEKVEKTEKPATKKTASTKATE